MKKTKLFLLPILSLLLTGCDISNITESVKNIFDKTEEQNTNKPEEKPSTIISVTGISLSNISFSLRAGETKTLVATVLPSDATNKNVIWESSNTNVATVVDGVVNAIAEGNASITATTEDGSFEAECDVTVLKPVINVTGVSLNSSSLNLGLNETYQLIATAAPENATNKNVVYTVGDANVATVNENGYVVAVNEGNTTITVTTEDGGFKADCLVEVIDNTPIDVVVNNMSSTVVAIQKNKSTAMPGDEIELTIIAKNEGYEVNEVTATDSNSKSVALTKSNNKYVYNLPEDGVINVTSTVKGVAIRGFITDEHGLINGNPFMSTDNGATFIELTEKSTYESIDYYTFEYGALIKFTLAQVGDYIPTGLSVDGTNYTVNNNYEVTFKVVLEDLQYDFINIVPTYKYDGAPTGAYEIEVRNSTHLTAQVYWSAEDTHPATTIDKDINAVVRITTSDERYECREIEIKYFNTTETTSAKTMKASFVEVDEDSYWAFKVPYSGANKIIITVSEADTSLLKDLNLGGTYLTFKVSPAVYKISSFDSDVVTLSNSGDLKIYSGDNLKNYDTINSYDSKELKTITHQSYVYGTDCFMFSTDSSSTGMISSSFGSYNTFCIKKENASDSVNDYSIDAERFVVDNNAYVVYSVYHGTKLINSGFAEMNAKTVYFNSDINLISGESATADKAVYTITKDSSTLKVIGYNGTGGNTNRCFLGDYYGYYGTNNELFIFGSLSAMYDNTTFNYELSDNRITLTTAERKVVIDINLDKTITVISDESLVVTLPVFAGYAFRNNYAFEDDYVYYGFYIEFSSSAQTLSCVGASNYNLDLTNCGTQQFAKNIDVAYTYDEASCTISAYLQVKDKSTKLVTMTYVAGSPNKIKLSSSVIGSGKLYSTTASLSQI